VCPVLLCIFDAPHKWQTHNSIKTWMDWVSPITPLSEFIHFGGLIWFKMNEFREGKWLIQGNTVRTNIRTQGNQCLVHFQLVPPLTMCRLHTWLSPHRDRYACYRKAEEPKSFTSYKILYAAQAMYLRGFICQEGGSVFSWFSVRHYKGWSLSFLFWWAMLNTWYPLTMQARWPSL
jgi:hypothetical protein